MCVCVIISLYGWVIYMYFDTVFGFYVFVTAWLDVSA